jgi:hypothetical protein
LVLEPGPTSGPINFLAYPVMEQANKPLFPKTFFSFQRKKENEDSEDQVSLR